MSITLYGYYQENSGVQIYARKLYQNLNEKSQEVEIVEPPKILKPRALNQFLLNSFKLKTLDAELLHLTNQDDLSTILPFPSKDNLVVTVHDIFRHHGESGNIDELRGGRYLKNIQKHADKVIAISEYTKEQLLEHSRIEEERIEVIYQGIDTEEFKPQGEVEHENYLLHVGTEIPRKNIPGLIRIFSKLKEDRPEMKLVRVGEISDKTEKEIEKEGLELGEDIIYEKDVSFSRLKALYTNAEKLAFPSSAEGFGRPIVEALACETPVVAYDKKPMSEILPGNMLVDFENEEDFAEKLNSEFDDDFREIAKRFNWEKTAEETLEVYEEFTDV